MIPAKKEDLKETFLFGINEKKTAKARIANMSVIVVEIKVEFRKLMINSPAIFVADVIPIIEINAFLMNRKIGNDIAREIKTGRIMDIKAYR